MKKRTKQSLIVTFAVGALCIGAFGIGNVATAKAETTPEETSKFTLTENSFIMEGASIRLENDANGNGIRFPVRLALQDYMNNSDFIEETGTLIVPKTYYAEGCLTVENALTENSVVHLEKTTGNWFKRTVVDAELQTTEYAESLVYLYNIPVLDEEFYVRGYIKTATDIIYSPMIDRSMSEVAYSAIESGYYAGDETVISALQNYLQEYTVEFAVGEYAGALEEQTVKYGGTVETPELVLTNDNMIFSHWELNGAKYDFNSKVTSDLTLTAKYISVAQYLESKLLDSNDLALFNDAKYKNMLSDLIVDDYNYPLSPVENYPNGWYFDAMNVGGYGHIRINVQDSKGGGFRVTFPRQQAWDANGSLKIRVAKTTGKPQTLRLYNYNETDADNAVTVVATSAWDGWDYIYVPVAPFLNGDGVLEGIQFSFYNTYWTHFGTVEYVPYGITENISSASFTSGESYDIAVGATNAGVAIDNADIRYTVANESILTIADGKLNVLKGGTTIVTIGYYANNKLQVNKQISVTVAKSDLEIVADGLTGNELAVFSNQSYKSTISNLLIEGATTATGWSISVNGNKAYNCISLPNLYSANGLRVKFAKPMQVSTGYIRICFAINTTNTFKSLSIYNYSETNPEKTVDYKIYSHTWNIFNNGVTVNLTEKDAITSSGWYTLYVPVEDLRNEQGYLEGIQFIRHVTSITSFGSIVYVTELGK